MLRVSVKGWGFPDAHTSPAKPTSGRKPVQATPKPNSTEDGGSGAWARVHLRGLILSGRKEEREREERERELCTPAPKPLRKKGTEVCDALSSSAGCQ